jgi:hypothetical protein
MVSQSDNGDVGGIWKSSMGARVGDWGDEVFGDNEKSFDGKVVCGLCLGEDDGVARLSKSWMVFVIVLDSPEDDVGLMVLLKQQGLTLILEVFLDD